MSVIISQQSNPNSPVSGVNAFAFDELGSAILVNTGETRSSDELKTFIHHDHSICNFGTSAPKTPFETMHKQNPDLLAEIMRRDPLITTMENNIRSLQKQVKMLKNSLKEIVMRESLPDIIIVQAYVRGYLVSIYWTIYDT